MNNSVTVGFIGNPNCGKTTLFNAYTGANLKVANWPGVTVEKKEGHTTYEGQDYTLIDLPGIYSLTSYTMEEKVSRECILSAILAATLAIGYPVALDASAEERLTRGLTSITQYSNVSGCSAYCTLHPPVIFSSLMIFSADVRSI